MASINRELIWFLFPVIAILWQAGGTWNKDLRRLIIPHVLTLATILFCGFSMLTIVQFVAILTILRLPFTLFGNSIHSHWFNWVWIWISGALLGLTALPLGIQLNSVVYTLVLAMIPCFVQGICGTLSNIKCTARFFKWKFVEGMIGMAFALPYCFLINR